MAIYTFKQVYEELLDWANRPNTDPTMIARAKGCVNDAVLWANRSHNFKLAQGISEFVYPANTLSVDLSTVILTDKVTGISTVQLLGRAGQTTGNVVPFLSYEEVLLRRYDSSNRNPSPQEYTPGKDTFLNMVEQNYSYVAFRHGDKFGLFPTPTKDVNILLTYNKLLPVLSADGDSNFLLDYCKDWIILKALARFNLYLKDDTRVQFTESLIKQQDQEWQSILRWDDELITNNQIKL